MSWAVPYMAGLYALALQIHPDMKPELFWNNAFATAKLIKTTDGATLKIVDPSALMQSLRQ